ncbi:MAG: hypothetical protein FMNOHCHN_00904 [Ignavibacteriaceae bacterium]|nr:hypothetical protein [Ignavibacteriaceae bacterium]
MKWLRITALLFFLGLFVYVPIRLEDVDKEWHVHRWYTPDVTLQYVFIWQADDYFYDKQKNFLPLFPVIQWQLIVLHGLVVAVCYLIGVELLRKK